ncbi:MAG TPA: phosphoglycerate kinase [Candidatus Nanoarchaeia archaeon]|nr:phosphoglycerate kinase [Candidatus Nanoarchaeia archaeon]
MVKLPSIKDKGIELEGKVVIVRTGMDVPLDDKGSVMDDSRIVEAVPTIEYLIKKSARVVLLTHINRPGGKVVETQRVASTAARLSELLQKEVRAITDCVGEEVAAAVKEMKDGEIVFLENLRFHPEEEANDDAFAQQLAKLGHIYVNDAFSNSHRAHASIVAITRHLPSYAGLLLEKEIKALSGVLEKPKKPFVVVLGGAKVSDKIGVIKNLGAIADKILIGGAMMFTFYRSRGFDVGSSKFEADKVSLADDLINELDAKIVLPVDAVVADKFANDARAQVVAASEIPKGWMGLDIGPDSVARFAEELREARTIVWNGPMGVFELPKFSEGTAALARVISELTPQVSTIIGGGDTLSAVDKLGLKGKFSHTSTGGGAMLELLEGKTLPGIAALLEAASPASKDGE